MTTSALRSTAGHPPLAPEATLALGFSFVFALEFSNETKNRLDPWFDRYVFPGGVLPSMRHLAAATEGDWALEDVHNLGPDYGTTLMAWHQNLSRHWHELPWADAHFRRTWHYYLLACAGTFRARALQLWQLVFTRTRRCSPIYAGVR